MSLPPLQMYRSDFTIVSLINPQIPEDVPMDADEARILAGLEGSEDMFHQVRVGRVGEVEVGGWGRCDERCPLSPSPDAGPRRGEAVRGRDEGQQHSPPLPLDVTVN